MERQQRIVLVVLAIAISSLFLPIFETHYLEKDYCVAVYGYEFSMIYPLIGIHCLFAYFIPFNSKTTGWVLWSVTLAFFLLFMLFIAFAISFSPGGVQIEEQLEIGSLVLLTATLFLFGYGFYCLLKTKSAQK